MSNAGQEPNPSRQMLESKFRIIDSSVKNSESLRSEMDPFLRMNLRKHQKGRWSRTRSDLCARLAGASLNAYTCNVLQNTPLVLATTFTDSNAPNLVVMKTSNRYCETCVNLTRVQCRCGLFYCPACLDQHQLSGACRLAPKTPKTSQSESKTPASNA